jgi:segregation and condensation protein B
MAEQDEGSARKTIEAALFVAGRPLDLLTLSSISRLRSQNRTRKVARAIASQYRQSDGAVEVVELPDERFVMRVRREYSESVRRIAVKPLVTRGALKTLTLIALRQPLTQSQLVKMRGPQAYDHVKELMRDGLVKGVKVGRTLLLSTTTVFSDMFDLSRETSAIKRQLQEMIEKSPAPQEQEDAQGLAQGERPTESTEAHPTSSGANS